MPTYKKTNQLNSIDAAYIAGLIDGEGTVSLTRRHKNENRQLEISISNTDLSLLEYVKICVGTGRISRKKTYSDKHTPSATYTVSNRQALKLLEQLSPYLRTYKKQRSQLILNNYLRLTPRNGKYTEQLNAERQKFINDFFEIKPITI